MISRRSSLNVSRCAQPDLLEERVGQRLGGDHQRVDRRDRAAQAGQASGEAFGRAHDDVGRHGSRLAADLAIVELDDAGLLVDRGARLLDGLGQPADEAGGVDRSAVRCVAGAQHVARVDASRGLVGRQPAIVLLAEAPRAVVLEQLVNPADLRLVARQVEVAALGEVAVDALLARHAGDLVDGVVHRALERDGPVATVLLRHLLEAHRQERRQPTTVAAAGTEPGELGLEDDDAQRRVDLMEVVRGPQSGVAGADDRHVGGDIARQLLARCQVVIGRKRVEPEGNCTWVGHRSDTTQYVDDASTLAPMLPTPTGWFPDPWNELGRAVLGRSRLDGSRRPAG